MMAWYGVVGVAIFSFFLGFFFGCFISSHHCEKWIETEMTRRKNEQ